MVPARALRSLVLICAFVLPGTAVGASKPACTASQAADIAIDSFAAWDAGDVDGIVVSVNQTLGPFGIALPRRKGRPWPSDVRGYDSSHGERAELLRWLHRRVPLGDRVRLLELKLIHEAAAGDDHWGFDGSFRRRAPDIAGSRRFYVGHSKLAVDCRGLLALGAGRSYWHRSPRQHACGPTAKTVRRVRSCGFAHHPTYGPPLP